MQPEIKILLVEDEALIAQNIKMQLEDVGYTIAGVCYNYEVAAMAIENTVFDVLITDINLGQGVDINSGLDIAKQLKNIKDCPIIFLTAFSDKDTIKKSASISPAAYLVKPVNAAGLFAAVQLALENFYNTKKKIEDNTITADYFFIKQGTKMVRIFWRNVYHLEATKNYVKIKSTEQSSAVLLRTSLQQVLQFMIPIDFQNHFVKINRAEAIAKKIIIQVYKNEIETTYGKFKIGNDFDKNYL